MYGKALFWDFDGTLTFSAPLWSRCIAEALSIVTGRTDITADEIREHTHARRIYPWDTPDRDHTKHINEAFWSYVENGFEAAYIACGTDEPTAKKAAALVRGLILRPENYRVGDDVLPALKTAKILGYRSFILSNNFPELPQLMEQLGLSMYFDGCIVSGAEGYDKPRRELFDIATERAGHPDTCIMIGDNPTADVIGGKKAGMITVLVHRGDESEADYTCLTLDALREILLKHRS